MAATAAAAAAIPPPVVTTGPVSLPSEATEIPKVCIFLQGRECNIFHEKMDDNGRTKNIIKEMPNLIGQRDHQTKFRRLSQIVTDKK